MAFPAIASADTKTAHLSTSASTWTITYPTNIGAGDLLLLAIGDISKAATATGWTTLLQTGFLTVLGKVATGSESGTFSLAISGGVDIGGWISARIPASEWYGGSLAAGTTSNGSDGVEGTTATGTFGTTPDPPSNSPAWGSADNLWIAIAAFNGSPPISAYPASYTDYQVASGGPYVAMATRALAGASEDPGVYTLAGSSNSRSATLAIRPAGATGASVAVTPLVVKVALSTVTAAGAGLAAVTPLTVDVTLSTVTATGSADVDVSPLSLRVVLTSVTATGEINDEEPVEPPVTITPGSVPITPVALAAVLTAHQKPVSRITLLDADLQTTLAVLTPLDGSVTWERGRDTQRGGSFSVPDPDGTLTDELLIEDRVVRVERGAYVGLTPQYAQLLTGRITEVTTSLASGVVSVTVESRLSLLNRPFAVQTTFDAGVRLRDIGRSIAEAAGYGTDNSLYDLNDNGVELAVARTCEIGDDMLAALVGIFADSGLDVWDTGAGVLTSDVTPDPLTTTLAWEFAPGALILEHSKKRTAHQAAVNRVRVTGRGPDGYPIYGEVRITNPSHPLFWTSTLDLPQFVDRPEASTVEACLAIATQLLIEGSSITEAHALNAVPIPLILEHGRPVVSVGDDRLRLDTVTMPLRKGGMAFTAQAVRSIA